MTAAIAESGVVHILGYDYDHTFARHYTSRFDLRFAALQIASDKSKAFRREFSWAMPTMPADEKEPHLLHSLEPASETESRNILERNVADLVTMHITSLAAQDSAFTVVMGPPIRKITERLAYRCLTGSMKVAFITWPDIADATFFNGPESEGWSGPYPSFHEDSLLRTFHFKGSSPESVPVRVDLYNQTLGTSARAQDRSQRLLQSMSSVSDLIAAQPFIQSNRVRTEIPYHLGMLHMSLRWSDRKVIKELERIEAERPRLDKKDKERIAAVKHDGVFTGLTQPDTRKHVEYRQVKDNEFAREELFARLQKEVEIFGMTEGLLRFIRLPGTFSE